MKNIFNLVLAFAFGIATLAACERVAVPTVHADVSVSKAAPQPIVSDSPYLDAQAAQRAHSKSVVVAKGSAKHAAHKTKVAAGKKSAGAAERARAEQAAGNKAAMNFMRAACLNYAVDNKIAHDIASHKIHDYGNVLTAPVCADYRT